jgi:hypothetical protein
MPIERQRVSNEKTSVPIHDDRSIASGDVSPPSTFAAQTLVDERSTARQRAARKPSVF